MSFFWRLKSNYANIAHCHHNSQSMVEVLLPILCAAYTNLYMNHMHAWCWEEWGVEWFIDSMLREAGGNCWAKFSFSPVFFCLRDCIMRTGFCIVALTIISEWSQPKENKRQHKNSSKVAETRHWSYSWTLKILRFHLFLLHQMGQ
jgi:hypothetical protein